MSPRRSPQPWELEPFKRFDEEHHKADRLLHTVRDAMHFVQGRPYLIEQLRPEWGDEKTARELARARANAETALAEDEAGHPMLHAQAVVLLWGGLEALLSDFLGAWLLNVHETRELDPIKNLKINFGEYETLALEDRGAYLLERLEEKLGTRRAGGIERFEVIFRLFGLSSPIEPGVVRDLLELSAVRNLLVHRRGVVDSRFRTQCPWTTWSVGAQLIVTHAAYHRYFDAVDLYVFEITQRLLEYHGIPRTGHQPTCRFHRPAEVAPSGDETDC